MVLLGQSLDKEYNGSGWKTFHNVRITNTPNETSLPELSVCIYFPYSLNIH